MAPTQGKCTPTPPGAGTEELRFATVMTGGVSLAIWMGGVARELNLLEQASRRRVLTAADRTAPEPPGSTASDGAPELLDLYGRLLEMLDLTVDVDVLSGTSAGGINAAFLGVARARGLDIGGLRN